MRDAGLMTEENSTTLPVPRKEGQGMTEEQ